MIAPSADAITISEDDQQRSDVVRNLVQSTRSPNLYSKGLTRKIPRTIVQYWNDLDNIPKDVKVCLDSWNNVSRIGCERKLFDDNSARRFISKTFTQHHVEAFDRCYHPAMRSDYFRLCFILSHGGCYIDADDIYCGTDVEYLFRDHMLKLQPLCYDVKTGAMIEPDKFTKSGHFSRSWIFYFNNNPILASAGDPIIKYALSRATRILVHSDKPQLPEIQSTTGPGNLTSSVVAHAATSSFNVLEEQLLILSEWDEHARTVWSLNYRNDTRNWRLSNRQRFQNNV